MGKLFKVFFKPGEFFEQDVKNIRLSTLGVLYAVLIFYFLVISVIQGLIIEQGIVYTLLSFFGTWVLGFLVFIPIFALVAKVVINTKNKDFSFYDGLKVILSAYVISYTFQVVTSTLSLVLTYASRGFITSVDLLGDVAIEDAAELQGLASQGLLFGGLGLVLACLTFVGFIWSFVAEVIGLSKVGKVDTGMGFAAALVANIVGFIVNFLIGAVVGTILGVILVSTI